MTVIQGATGPIDTGDLGFTLMHEHVIVTWPAIHQQYPHLWDRPAIVERSVRLLKDAYAAGVRTMVDLTPIDLGRDPLLIKEVAEKSGMQFIVATGCYYSIPFYFVGRPDSEMTEFFVRDITEGIGDTGVRAGVIKCATEPEMHAMNERVLRASARAHRETGVPICTHTMPANKTGWDQQRVFKEEGVDLGRTVIGHSDDSDSFEYLERIILDGSYLGMDRIGGTRPRTSEQRADMVAALVEKGYADRIMLSHDHQCYFDWVPKETFEASPKHFGYIATGFSDLLRERGVSDASIKQMTVLNPKALFEQAGGY